MSIFRPPAGTTVTEADGGESPQEYAEGIEITQAEATEWRTGTVVEPTAEETEAALVEICGYAEGETTGHVVVAWDDPDGQHREWVSADEVIRYRVVDDLVGGAR